MAVHWFFHQILRANIWQARIEKTEKSLHLESLYSELISPQWLPIVYKEKSELLFWHQDSTTWTHQLSYLHSHYNLLCICALVKSDHEWSILFHISEFALACCCCLVWLFCSPMDCNLSMGFPRQEYWRALPFLSPRDLPDPGIEPVSHWQADSLPKVI